MKCSWPGILHRAMNLGTWAANWRPESLSLLFEWRIAYYTSVVVDQVTIEYVQKADGSVEPQKIHTVVISTQHAEPSKRTRKQECAGYTGADETAPSMEQMNKLIEEKVIRRTLSEIKLKNGKPGCHCCADFLAVLPSSPLFGDR